jgi:hypothetical protein
MTTHPGLRPPRQITAESSEGQERGLGRPSWTLLVDVSTEVSRSKHAEQIEGLGELPPA